MHKDTLARRICGAKCQNPALYLHKWSGTHGHRWLENSPLDSFMYMGGMFDVWGCSDCPQ